MLFLLLMLFSLSSLLILSGMAGNAEKAADKVFSGADLGFSLDQLEMGKIESPTSNIYLDRGILVTKNASGKYDVTSTAKYASEYWN